MALPASIPLPSISPKFRRILLEDKSYQLNSCLLLPVRRNSSLTRVRMAQFMDPGSVPIKIVNLREKMQEAMPDPVKSFPWKKAERILLERLLFTAKNALKWSLLLLLVFSSFSDFVVSIIRNQELMIPTGLFVGVLLADLFKEISQEAFPSSEDSSLKLQLIAIGGFFVFIKLISFGFTIKTQTFLLHVANGGLMQVFWLWRNFSGGKNQTIEQSFPAEGTS